MTFKLFNRDCIDLSDVEPNISLVYLDPPYSSKTEDKYFGVGNTFDEYLSFIHKRLLTFKSILHPKGANVVIHIDQKASHYIKVMMDELYGRSNFKNEIIWCYSSPSIAKKHLPRKHDVLLNYGLGDYPFNPEYAPHKAFRPNGDKGWNPETDWDKLKERGKLLEDWWEIPSLCRNEGEKTGYKTQKPLKLMDRLVRMFSNEGDTILDPFCGSGSFLEAGLKLNRNVIGIDVSKEAIEIAGKRLEECSKQMETSSPSEKEIDALWGSRPKSKPPVFPNIPKVPQ